MRHGEITRLGDEFNKDTFYFCAKCLKSHTTNYAGCDGLRTPIPIQDLVTCAEEKHNPANPLAVQVAGDHYKKLKIQPIEFIHANGIPFAEGSVIKYVTRWRDKGGIKDLEKARHFLDLLIDLERKAKE